MTRQNRMHRYKRIYEQERKHYLRKGVTIYHTRNHSRTWWKAWWKAEKKRIERGVYE